MVVVDHRGEEVEWIGGDAPCLGGRLQQRRQAVERVELVQDAAVAVGELVERLLGNRGRGVGQGRLLAKAVPAVWPQRGRRGL